jgi:HTH-type transcriptional regulator/antitoxin HigA
MGKAKQSAKAIRVRRGVASDPYLDLVREFPLRTIKSDAEHDRAIAVASRLMGTDLDEGSGDYLDTLLVLITKYEDEHHAVDESMTPQQALRALMKANELTQADIGRIIGSESAVSMFLAGSRGLSKAQIKKLSARFHLNSAVFLG